MTWKGTHPLVKLVTTTYKTGETLTKDAMRVLEITFQRLPKLGKWFIDIVPASPNLLPVSRCFVRPVYSMTGL